MATKNFELFIGYLGNGATVCNSAVYEHGDYKTIAHISNAGNIKFYVAPDYIPAEAMQKIQETAEEHKKKTLAALDQSLNITKYSKMGPEYAKMQEEHERGRWLDKLSRYLPWSAFDEFLKEYKAATTTEEKNAAIIKYIMLYF